MKIIVLDGYTSNPGDLSWDALQKLGQCTLYDRTPKSKIVERCRDATIILTNKAIIDAETIEALPKLKYIGVMATGFNVVDTAAAAKRGIPVTNVPAYSSESVAQMVFSQILSFSRRIETHANGVRAGKWSDSEDFAYWDTPQQEISGKTLGLIGFGAIGEATARIGLAFGMNVIASRKDTSKGILKGVKVATNEEVFANSDFLSLHCPLNAETKHIINAENIAKMKKNAFLINTGRGPLIDEDALAAALKSNLIAGAGLDVLSQEPPKTDNPLLPLKNCFITPHIAWATYSARVRLISTIVKNIESWRDGTPKNVVN